MGGRIVLERAGIDLERSFVESVAAARKEEVHAPLAILVGSNLLGSHLRRTLAARLGGIFNIRFLTLADLAETLARAAGGDAGSAPRFADRVIAGELVSSRDVSTVFGEAAKTRGFVEALLATFSDLAEAGCSRDAAGAILGGASGGHFAPATREVLALYASFREGIERLGGDVHSVFQSALAAPVPPSIGAKVFAYGFYDFNEMQRRLLVRLSRERDVTLFIPWEEGEAYRFVARSRKRLEESGFETAASAGTKDERPACATKLLNVPGEEQEIREIARRIIGLAGAGEVRFGEMALVLPSLETYGPLCGEVLGEAGIPYYLNADAFAARSAAAKGAAALLAMLGGAMERRDLVEFLVSAPLVSAEAAPETVDLFALWVRRSAEAGLAGERGWIAESAALVERLALAAEKDPGEGEAHGAAVEVDRMIGIIQGAGEAARRLTTWRGHAMAVSSLLRELFVESEDREAVCGAIEALGALDATGSGVSFEKFSRLAVEA
ncbi:MAG TPA: hypothetical protein VMT60_01460, partial [Candidatus Bathyarchaeia archaeon]|nr:hypothetical protein [Candidatus Bathyarchaeia archaeon]